LRQGNLALCTRKDLTEGGEASFAGLLYYGTYEWKGYVTEEVGNWSIYLGFAEAFPAGWRDAIFLWYDGENEKWLFDVIKEGSTSSHEITGTDFTNEHIFKVVWTQSNVTLYIDSNLEKTHTTNIPIIRMTAFVETLPDETTHATNDHFVYCKDWQHIT